MPKSFELVILDRDGVINDDPEGYINTPEKWHALPGSLAAIAKLYQAGYKIVVVSNQSGIGRGLITPTELERVHQKMLQEIEACGGHLEGIFFCPHGPEANCECRKPKPGLLWQISKKLNIPPKKTLSIGDSLRDMLAAENFGCAAMLVLTGNGKKTLQTHPEYNRPDVAFQDLAAAAEWLCQTKPNVV